MPAPPPSPSALWKPACPSPNSRAEIPSSTTCPPDSTAAFPSSKHPPKTDEIRKKYRLNNPTSAPTTDAWLESTSQPHPTPPTPPGKFAPALPSLSSPIHTPPTPANAAPPPPKKFPTVQPKRIPKPVPRSIFLKSIAGSHPPGPERPPRPVASKRSTQFTEQNLPPLLSHLRSIRPLNKCPLMSTTQECSIVDRLQLNCD